MTLQEQVCTLEQAKRLKELGCKQESYFGYVYASFHNHWSLYAIDYRSSKEIAAYTVAELGEMLVKQGVNAMPYVAGGLWWRQTKYYQTEAQARAALLIHILEQEKEHDT